jgi:hypothetical protein
MREFKEGDVVRGKVDNDQPVANEYCTMICLDDEDEDGEVQVEVKSHEYNENVIGDVFWVDVNDLELVSSNRSSSSLKNGVPGERIAVSNNKASLLKIKKLG